MPPLDYGHVPTFSSSAQTVPVTYVIDLAPWSRGAQDRVAALAALPQGWDGSDSPPVSNSARERVLNLLSLASKLKMAAPHIVPVPGGGLQSEWRTDRKQLEVEFFPDGTGVYLLVNPEKKMLSEELLNQDSLTDLIPALLWFTSKKDNWDETAPYARTDG